METTQDKNNAALLLRLPEDLKAALQRQATLSGRRITSEINTRLRQSLERDKETLKEMFAAVIPPDPAEPLVYPKSQATAHHIKAYTGTSDLDQAMLKVFHALPVEKQLSLLTLLK